MSKDLRLLIVGNIISNGRGPETGVVPGEFVKVARPLGISSAVVSKIWKSLLSQMRITMVLLSHYLRFKILR